MMKSAFFLSILCFIVTACNSTLPKNTVSLDTLAAQMAQNPNTAIVMGTSDWIAYEMVAEPSHHEAMITMESGALHPGDPGYQDAVSAFGTHEDPSHFSDIHAKYIINHYALVAPGSYTISSVALPGRGMYGAVQNMIDLKPGDIVYIGHLVLYHRGMTNAMRVEDRFDQFAKEYPIPAAWQGRIQKRLLSVPLTPIPSM